MQEKLSLIPHKPGSYQYYDKTGKIIYVGKAKDLNKRVHSYFNRPQFGKTAKLVSEICDLTYTVTDTETEAFLLEINLISSQKSNLSPISSLTSSSAIAWEINSSKSSIIIG